MVEKKTWDKPTHNEKIVALQAMVKAVDKKVANEFKKGKASHTRSKTAISDRPKKRKGKSDARDNHPSNWPPPKTGKKKENMFKKYKWYWCGKETGGHCELWRAHKPEDCRGGTKKSEGTSNKKKRDSPEDQKKWKDQNAAKKLKIAKAYVAKMEATCNNTYDDESVE